MGDNLDKKAKSLADGLPKSVGVSSDTSFLARLAINMSAWYVGTAMRASARLLNGQANSLRTSVEKDRMLRVAELKSLELADELNGASSEATLADLRNQVELIQSASTLEQGIVRELIGLYEQETAASLAYERDLVELRDRRDEIYARMIEAGGLDIQVRQAELTVEQALGKYKRIVLSAQLVEGRLFMVRSQLQNINQIIGSPAAVFAWANRLTGAESRLERAKDSVREWLVALEYFAVRPFFDQRIQILLARNTTQLEEIAQELERLQNSCGGAVNTLTVDVSVRTELLGITSSHEDRDSGLLVTPVERFRSVLNDSPIPVDKRVRYSADQSIGDLVTRGGILAATFDIGINDFANLQTTCNAKIASISIELVGEDLGDARPTVSLLYDGTSRLRSCQADIQAIVDLVGPDITPFAPVTTLKTAGRSISPLAGIGEFLSAGSENRTLANLPLVSQYTVLIDPTVGENADVDWDKLDDILLRVEYTYQDVFPAGQCQ